MNQPDFTYIHSDCPDRWRPVRILAHGSQQEHLVKAAALDGKLLSNNRLFALPIELLGRISDLIDLAVAVNLADWLSCSRKDVCTIQIELPVHYPDLIGCSAMTDRLEEILYWYTRNRWSFDFTLRQSPESWLALKPYMFPQPAEVALWSGGLDSLAGLCTRMSRDLESHHILFGTGSNNRMLGTQKQLAKDLAQRFPGRTELIQVPIRVQGAKEIRKNSNWRARGFVFMLLGAACAYMVGQNRLHIYENGVGAINLPFQTPGGGIDHTRGVHPLSLLYVGDFVSDLLDTAFQCENPFLFWTKAKMCEILTENGTSDLMFKTISCDGLLRERPGQCGHCSSCLLRRQALAVLGIEDETGYMITENSLDGAPPPFHSAHLRAMLRQVDTLKNILESGNPWTNFSKKYPRMADIVDQLAPRMEVAKETIIDALIDLYERYVREWDSAKPVVGQGLLPVEERMQPDSLAAIQ